MSRLTVSMRVGAFLTSLLLFTACDDAGEPASDAGIADVAADSASDSGEGGSVPAPDGDVTDSAPDGDDGGAGGCLVDGGTACTTECGSAGEWTCDAGGEAAACVGSEVCNACDDDDDGMTDEAFFCEYGEVAECMTSCGNAGHEACAGDCGSWSACGVDRDECGGGDDDGDGVADIAVSPLAIEATCGGSYSSTGFVATCTEVPEVHVIGVYEGVVQYDTCTPPGTCSCTGGGCDFWSCAAGECKAQALSGGAASFHCSEPTCRMDFDTSGGVDVDCVGSTCCWVRFSGSGGCDVACGEDCEVEGSCTVTCATGTPAVTAPGHRRCGDGCAEEPQAPPPASVTVSVDRSGVPLALVLSGFDPIEWDLNVKEGVDLERIILNGIQQTVVGAPAGVVPEETNLGCAYEWPEDGGCSTECVVEDIEALTGSNVTSFTGCYWATGFSIADIE